MKRKMYSVIGFMLLLGTVLLTGCSSQTESAENPETVTYDLQSIYDGLAAVNPIDNARDVDDFSVENDFGLNLDSIENYVGKISGTLSNSALILIVEAKGDAVSEVESALKAYQEKQITYFGNYAEFADAQMMVKNGRIVSKGNYVLIVFANTEGADYGEIDSAIDVMLNQE